MIKRKKLKRVNIRKDPLTNKFLPLEENELTLKAFEIYYNQGLKRSYKRTAKEVSVTIPTIFNWSKKFNWQTRIKERNNEFSNDLKEATTNNVIGIKVRYSNAVATLVKDFLLYCDEMKKIYELKRREWNKKNMMYRQDRVANPDPGPKPKPFTIIKDISDLEKIVKLELLLLGESTDRKEQVTREKDDRITDLIKTDESVRSLLADAWRKTRIQVLQGGKKDTQGQG